jgi:hypothetical protein
MHHLKGILVQPKPFMKSKLFTALKIFALIVIVGTLAAVVYDVLFSKPLVMTGVIIDKVHMASKEESGQNIMPYMRYKSYDYVVTAQTEEQWIAFVKTPAGEILKVHCHVHHYEQTQVGDTLRFKEYTGEIFHIDYFTHNEEDEDEPKTTL